LRAAIVLATREQLASVAALPTLADACREVIRGIARPRPLHVPTSLETAHARLLRAALALCA